MNSPTQEQIDKAIKKCMWRSDTFGVSICKGECMPCSKVIDSGNCDTLIKLFGGEREEIRLMKSIKSKKEDGEKE